MRQGQPAFIRFTAFDQRTTPEFEAKVTRVAADLTTDQQTGASYYVARLSLSTETTANGKRIDLSLVLRHARRAPHLDR